MSKFYSYYAAVADDVREYLDDNDYLFNDHDRSSLEDYLNDELWFDDGVTGNASGSYTFNSYKAQEYLVGNWDLLAEAMQELGCEDANILEKGPEWCDVTIRCYVLGCCISDVLDDLEEESIWDDDEEEEEGTNEEMG